MESKGENSKLHFFRWAQLIGSAQWTQRKKNEDQNKETQKRMRTIINYEDALISGNDYYILTICCFFYADLIRPQASKIRCFSDASFHRFGSGHTCKPSIRQRKILSLEIHALKQIWRPINWIKTFKKLA